MKLQDAVISRIEELKKSKGISQYKLSEDSGVPQTTLISIKRKRCKSVTLVNLYKICKGLDCSILQFFDSPLFNDLDMEF